MPPTFRSAPWRGRPAARIPGIRRSFSWTTPAVAYTQDDLERLNLREPLDLGELKQRWLAAVEDARATVTALPPEEVGSEAGMVLCPYPSIVLFHYYFGER